MVVAELDRIVKNGIISLNNYMGHNLWFCPAGYRKMVRAHCLVPRRFSWE
jgi:hypothetical protein